VEEASSAPFVLDFLYHDSRRIGSFLSQFEVDGHLQSFTRHKDAARSKKNLLAMKASSLFPFLQLEEKEGGKPTTRRRKGIPRRSIHFGRTRGHSLIFSTSETYSSAILPAHPLANLSWRKGILAF
jgi:hypothetical protein